jgi:hypothetical protein
MPIGHVQLASHPEMFPNIACEKTNDVSFIGQVSHGYRSEDKYLFPVIDKGYRGAFGGFTYKGVSYPYKAYTEINPIYNATKVNLNFHYPTQKEEREDNLEYRIDINGRTFDIAMSGNFQICDTPIVTNFFEDSIPVVTPDKWLETIDYYLTHEDEREAKAKRAKEIALAYHTYLNRAINLIQKLHNYE